MAISRLATSNPSANTDTLMYTRTGSRVALVSVLATNKSSDAATVRVWVVPLGEDNNSQNHVTITYDLSVAGKDTLETFRFPLAPSDKLYIRASSGDISFLLSGIDNTSASGTELTDVQALANKALIYALVDL